MQTSSVLDDTPSGREGQASTLALRLVTPFELRRDRLYYAVLEHARTMPQWSTFQSAPRATHWAAVLAGVATVLDQQSDQPLGGDWPEMVAAAVAHKYARYSHQPEAQRRRAYQRATTVRERSQDRDSAICRDRAGGMTYRALAERYGLSEGGCRKVVRRGAEKQLRQSTRTLPSLRTGVGEKFVKQDTTRKRD